MSLTPSLERQRQKQVDHPYWKIPIKAAWKSWASVMLVLWRLKQEECVFRAFLCYIARVFVGKENHLLSSS